MPEKNKKLPVIARTFVLDFFISCSYNKSRTYIRFNLKEYLMNIQTSFTINQKLEILSDAAKYDVACTSSGADRRGAKGHLGNSCASGICHSFAADGRCISLLKVLFSNECIYDCKYCLNRRSNDRVRTTFTPEELCGITVEFYKRNYIEGLFLSSGVIKSPDFTMELIYQTLYLLRNKYHFRGYIHAKAVPGAHPDLIQKTGYLADRMSVNIELPTKEGLAALAPGKTHDKILQPMSQIQQNIAASRLALGKSSSFERHHGNRYLPNSIFSNDRQKQLNASASSLAVQTAASLSAHNTSASSFVPAGQSTQMIIGAALENDYELLKVTQTLYQKFDLKRVFFSAYIPLNEDSLLPSPDTPPPLLREHRLYQADWLLRYYGFHAEELLSPEKPNFNLLLDPKCEWALRHLDQFPIEVSTASYSQLLKVPGIGNKSALRIVQARKNSTLDFSILKRLGLVLKRAQYFITCHGKMLYSMPIEENFITRQLTAEQKETSWKLEHPQTYQQLSLFDDHFLDVPPTIEDKCKSILGQF
jgi:putative DNA modification/repair radical SAM protein